jgi:hypothetical protein
MRLTPCSNIRNFAWCHLIAVALAAQGCGGGSTAKEKTWSHPTKSNQQFYTDRAECNAMSGSAGSSQITPAYVPPAVGGGGGFLGSFAQSYAFGNNLGEASRARDEKGMIFRDCMVGRGWMLTDKTIPTKTKPNTSPQTASEAQSEQKKETTSAPVSVSDKKADKLETQKKAEAAVEDCRNQYPKKKGSATDLALCIAEVKKQILFPILSGPASAVSAECNSGAMNIAKKFDSGKLPEREFKIEIADLESRCLAAFKIASEQKNMSLEQIETLKLQVKIKP